MTVLAIIPARGGSKGVPRKNLRKVAGRSLVARAVSAASDSGVADHILVSTDDPDIAAEARRAGAEVPFLRPSELASDDAAALPVFEHALVEYERQLGAAIDLILVIEPTVPFRTADHVAQAVHRYRKGDCRSVIAVCPLERKPENIFVKTPDGHLDRFIKEPKVNFPRRQEMDHLCRLSSGIYLVGRDDFLEKQQLIIEPVGFIEMTNLESINIDEPLDLEIANIVSEKYDM